MVLPEYNHADFIKYQAQLKKAGENIRLNDNKGVSDKQITKTPRPTFNPIQTQRNKPKGGIGNKVIDWINRIKPALKVEYKGKLSDYCALYNMKNNACNTKNQGHCRMFGRLRIHTCLCGSNKHRLHQCSMVFKSGKSPV